MNICEDIVLDGDLLLQISELLDDDDTSTVVISLDAWMALNELYDRFGDCIDFATIVYAAFNQNNGSGRDRLACLLVLKRLHKHGLISDQWLIGSVESYKDSLLSDFVHMVISRNARAYRSNQGIAYSLWDAVHTIECYVRYLNAMDDGTWLRLNELYAKNFENKHGYTDIHIWPPLENYWA